jgi:hypothetical protein
MPKSIGEDFFCYDNDISTEDVISNIKDIGASILGYLYSTSTVGEKTKLAN